MAMVGAAISILTKRSTEFAHHHNRGIPPIRAQLLGISSKSHAQFIQSVRQIAGSGTLVDVMCKGKDLAGHTTKCAVGCAKSGYGLVLSDGKFVKLDEGGNAKALAALKATSKEKDLKAKITGTLDGQTVQVESIELQ